MPAEEAGDHLVGDAELGGNGGTVMPALCLDRRDTVCSYVGRAPGVAAGRAQMTAMGRVGPVLIRRVNVLRATRRAVQDHVDGPGGNGSGASVPPGYRFGFGVAVRPGTKAFARIPAVAANIDRLVCAGKMRRTPAEWAR